MPAIYSIADIAVVPSLWEEPAGLVVIEAMASGLPCIVTDSGGITEYCSPDSAIILPRGDRLTEALQQSIDQLAESAELRSRLGAAGKKNAAKFDAPIYYRRLLDALARIGKPPDLT